MAQFSEGQAIFFSSQINSRGSLTVRCPPMGIHVVKLNITPDPYSSDSLETMRWIHLNTISSAAQLFRGLDRTF